MGILLQRNLSRTGRVTLALLALALIGLLAAQGCASSTQNQTVNQEGTTRAIGANVGDLAHDFTLADVEGNQVTLSDFRGKTVFVNFWATWCPPCRSEMPAIEALYQEYKDRDVVVIGVDLYESRDKVRKFVQGGGYSWLFVIDDTGEVARNYRIRAVPTSFFLDSEGIIREVTIGAMNKKTMESKLAKALR